MFQNAAVAGKSLEVNATNYSPKSKIGYPLKKSA